MRHTSDSSQDRREGRCTIRVRIEDEADVELRSDLIRIRPIRGGPGRDEGSECNAPLPLSGTISNFRFWGIDGRGTPRLVQEPAGRNAYVAVVNVQDPAAGDEGYTFELRWDWDGSASGGGWGGPTTRPTPPTGCGGIFPGPGGSGSGSLPDMNTSIAGSGTLNDGSAQFNLTDLNVRINGDMCRITLTNDRQQRFEMTGTFRHESNRCIINSSNRGSTSANALILTDGNRVTGVDVSGNVNGQNFQSNSRAR